MIGRVRFRHPLDRPPAFVGDIFGRLWVRNLMPEMRGYTGPNVRLGDYFVREVERTGTEHRQVVHFEVVGTGRVEKMPRSRFDRQARPA